MLRKYLLCQQVQKTAICIVLILSITLLGFVRPDTRVHEKDRMTGGVKKKKIGKMLGADISFLPQLESRGMKFSENGVEKDIFGILKDHKINYIRLRIFNDPAADSGYSPKLGFCDLEHTKQMAKRIKAAGMKFLLDCLSALVQAMDFSPRL